MKQLIDTEESDCPGPNFATQVWQTRYLPLCHRGNSEPKLLRLFLSSAQKCYQYLSVTECNCENQVYDAYALIQQT